MPLTLEWGSLADAKAAGVDDYLPLHWEESEDPTLPLAIDWPALYDLERRGTYRCLLLRRDRRLIGYSAFFLQPVIHHRTTRFAINDLVYVDPAERGAAGLYLLTRGEALLREIGVQIITYSVKPRRDVTDLGYKRGRDSVGALLQKLGYGLDEEVWAKRV